MKKGFVHHHHFLGFLFFIILIIAGFIAYLYISKNYQCIGNLCAGWKEEQFCILTKCFTK